MADTNCDFCSHHGKISYHRRRHQRYCRWSQCNCHLCTVLHRKRYINDRKIPQSIRSQAQREELSRIIMINDDEHVPIPSQVESSKEKVGVKSLLDLAVEPIYEDIISKLLLIFASESRQESSEDDGVELDKDAMVENIRKTFYKVGTCSQMRQKLVDLFIKKFLSPLGDDVVHRICLEFYNCILNESFNTFDNNAIVPGHPLERIDPVKLLRVVSQRSPTIETLKLYLHFPVRCLAAPSDICQHSPNPETLRFCLFCDRAIFFDSTFGRMFSKLEHLTSLTLSWEAAGDDCVSFFEALGESCPKLTHLQLECVFSFGIHQLLALMLGRKRLLLPQELIDQLSSGSVVTNLQFSPQSLTPICSSLQRFKSCSRPVSFLSLAFLYRHFSQLHEWVHGSSSFDMLQILRLLEQHKTSGISIAAQNSSEDLGLLQWTLNAPFQSI